MKYNNRKKYSIGLFVIILILTVSIFGKNLNDERESLFKNGVSKYSQNKYTEAVEIFHQLENTDFVSFELYYDIGNSYYRIGKLGKAIQYWEKAKIIKPSNDDVDFNLKLANVKLQDRVVLPKPFLIFKYYKSIKQNIDIKKMLNYIGLLFFVTILLFILPKIFDNTSVKKRLLKFLFIPKYLLILIIFFLFLILFDTTNYKNNNDFGIVIENKIKVKTEPKEDADTIFILHEGSKVKILSKFDRKWYKVSYFDDKIGWIEIEKIGEI
ncbi:MAG: tetratricopeptide repeat protein [Candidatus Marinimicrobia bacterium]|nr:tetratricopeptide repeat protein [Candidatus Neomarinimicrobiota bacterium]